MTGCQRIRRNVLHGYKVTVFIKFDDPPAALSALDGDLTVDGGGLPACAEVSRRPQLVITSPNNLRAERVYKHSSLSAQNHDCERLRANERISGSTVTISEIFLTL